MCSAGHNVSWHACTKPSFFLGDAVPMRYPSLVPVNGCGRFLVQCLKSCGNSCRIRRQDHSPSAAQARNINGQIRHTIIYMQPLNSKINKLVPPRLKTNYLVGWFFLCTVLAKGRHRWRHPLVGAVCNCAIGTRILLRR